MKFKDSVCGNMNQTSIHYNRKCKIHHNHTHTAIHVRANIYTCILYGVSVLSDNIICYH